MKKEEKLLHKAVDDAFVMAEEMFNEDGGFQSVILLDFGKKSLGIPLVDSTLVDARREILIGLGNFAAMAEELGLLGEPTVIRMMSEAWMSKPNPGEKKVVMPSKDPNKQEALIAYGSNRQGDQAQRVKQIVRSIIDTDGELLEKVELIEFKSDEIPEQPRRGETKFTNVLDLYWDAYHKTKKHVEDDGGLPEEVINEVNGQIGNEEKTKEVITGMLGSLIRMSIKAHEAVEKNDSNKS